MRVGLCVRLNRYISAGLAVNLGLTAVFMCWPVKGAEKEAVVVELNGSNQ